MKFSHGLLGIVVCAAAFGQNAQFEVASIRPAPTAPTDRVAIGVHIDGSQMQCTYLSIEDFIRAAYKLKQYQIQGPSWIAGERFNVAATLPPGATQDQVPEMIKALLIDRFKLEVHHDKKEFPVYGLVVAKGGLKIKETPPDPDAKPPAEGPAKPSTNVSGSGGRGGVHINLGNGSSFSFADNKLVATKLSMQMFAETLARFEDRPVIDMTGLPGFYDFELPFSSEDYTAMLIRSAIAAGVVLPPEALRALQFSSGDSLLSALERVGLKLETRKASLEVLVVDHVEKVPTEN
jgi:uncharacterized protein (TIGR03435 family)